MCASCGCQGEAKTTMLNLQTGAMTDLPGARPHEHEPVHAHRHGREHSHEHSHEHEHEDDVRLAPGRRPADRDHRHDHATHEHDHASHEHHLLHDHGDGHDHYDGHAHGPGGEVLSIESRILAKNDAVAAKNRAWLAGREILALNLVSSPGSGKTTLLERTIVGFSDREPVFVIEGDQASAHDGERIRKAGAPVVQINTGSGCHLDADMVARGLAELKPGAGSIVFIENVGNLVCPALFDLGERGKIVIFSITEGEDKPLKYPHMFRAASLVIINKIDLLPYVDFSMATAMANVRTVNPDAEVLQLSARSGEGMPAWKAWLSDQATAASQLGPL